MLELLILICFLAITNSFIAYFIEFCFYNGNIMDWYYLWIENKLSDKYPKIFNLLGGCIICLNFHISTILFICYHYWFKIEFIYYISYISISELVLMKLMKK